MFNRPNRNDVDDGVQDIQNDVNQLADSLESVLKSWGSDAKGEAEAARSKAQALLKETRRECMVVLASSKPHAMPLAARILLFVKDLGVAWVQQLR